MNLNAIPERQSFIKALLWSLAVSAISCCNDTLTKLVGSRLTSLEVAFFRFLFSTLTLLPFMLQQGRKNFRSPYIHIHILRAALLFMALTPWCYGVIILPLSLATALSFTTPLFVLILARIWLKEYVGIRRAMATCIGFCGILVSLKPGTNGFNFTALFLLASTFLFATLDILNKKLLNKEEAMLPMMFYSSLCTTFMAFPFALYGWETPTAQELCLLIWLGIGANGILYCLLKAFQAYDVSAIQPIRYTEFLFSCIVGWLIFGELPQRATLLGSLFIIPATAYLAYYERAREKSIRSKVESSL